MQQTPVQWAGLNHLALITNDVDTREREAMFCQAGFDQ